MAPDPKILDAVVPGGPSDADDQRHCYVRAGFMRELVTDPRVLAAFVACDDETHLLAAARQFASLGDELARLASLPDRSALTTWPVADLRVALDRIEPTDAHSQLLQTWQQTRDTIPSLYARVTSAILDRTLVPLVHDDPHLSWGWVVGDLKAHYAQLFWNSVLNQPTELHYVVSKETPAPDWRNGETFAQAAERHRAAVEATKYAHRHTPDKRRPSDGQTLERWGRWFYRVKVQQPPASISQIAREWQTRRKANKDVRTGVATAERYLDLKP
jgi:hypothetical protein